MDSGEVRRESCIVMLGASGAVGGVVARSLASNALVSRLTLLNRRPIESLRGKSVTQYVVDVFAPDSYAEQLPGHAVAICCLGVGQPSKVSREEFVRVDKTTVLDFARSCRDAGVTHFVLLSAVDASATSRSFYLRTKGELEMGIEALKFDRCSFFQPSMILTPNNRYGIIQGLLLAVWPKLSVLLRGSLARYRGIAVESLGTAIANAAVSNGSGVHRYRWREIAALSQK